MNDHEHDEHGGQPTHRTESLHGNALQTIRRLIVEVVAGPDRGLVYEGFADEEAISIGASPDNDIQLTDNTVSRYHAEVSLVPQGIRVADLGSTNGTYSAGLSIKEAFVGAGSIAVLGKTHLRLSDASERTAVRVEPPVGQLAGLIGASRAMQRVAERVERLATGQASVLIGGETGTGKSAAARAIHELSARREAPFVVVDCASMPGNLIASELFGHERGAFTGAHQRHLGAFERANGGTVFLDEIGDLPLELQPNLLGVLERRVIRRVGGSAEIPVDVRVIAATHRDLRASANSNTFRADLYYRLAVTRLHVPALRERTEDIPALVAHFVERVTGRAAHPALTPEWIEGLKLRPWPGNIRELRNAVENALTLGAHELDEAEIADAESSVDGLASAARDVMMYRDARAAMLARFEAEYLSQLIHSCNGNASEAARRAGMDRKYLLSLLRRHGLR